jgi:hypothetical protein
MMLSNFPSIKRRNPPLWRAKIVRFLTLWTATVPLSAQLLRVHAEPGAGGKDGAITVELEAAPGKQLTALQWELSVPNAIRIDSEHPEATDAARSAGKSIACRIQVNLRGGNVQFCRCILFGGVHSIPNGSITSLKYAAAFKTKPGSYDIAVKNVLAVGADAKSWPLKDTRFRIEISK